MIKITVGNSYSRIEGLTTGEFSAFKRVLSYELDPQQAYFAGGHRPKLRSLLDARGYFPTGLLHRVQKYFKGQTIQWERTNLYVLPESKFDKLPLPVTPHAGQLAALEAAKAHHRGIIAMPTGTGKSVVIAMIIKHYGLKTLVVVPNIEIKKQLSETLESIFGDTPLITVENIDSAKLKKQGSYDVLIIDEAHHVAAKTYHKLNKSAWSDIYYRYFLTATPYRNQENEQLLFEAIAGECIYELSYKDAIAKGFIAEVEAYYIDLPKRPNDCYTWQETYKKLVVENNERNAVIAFMLRSLNASEVPTLCLVKELKHGEILAKLTDVNFSNGQDEDSRKYVKQFNEGKLKALIGTTGILGEGVDTKPCAYVIIAGLGKAKSAFLQQVGRAVRIAPGKTSAKVILIRDPSHKYTLRHFNEQKKILKDVFGVTAIKLEV